MLKNFNLSSIALASFVGVSACATHPELNWKPKEHAQITLDGNKITCPVKLDTGAKNSSLHATDITVEEGFVKFKVLGTFYELAVSRTAQIAGEGERPAVNMSVRFGDFEEVEIEVNLRDRTKLDRKFLLGRNFMSKHNILVNSQRTPYKLSNDELECTQH